ncbi:MAG: metallophosphoesterase [Clostridia bacterium]|nr:metallophosphoesterase [Clostridia bacterium]
MAVFVISDLHLSFGTDKPMDVFGARWQNFEEKLKENWLKKIAPNDTVILPGDFSWGMTLAEAKPDFDFLEALPGQKILMKGNHEYYWNTLTKLTEFCDEQGYKTIRFLHNNAFEAEDFLIAGSRGWLCEASMKEADRKILDREVGRFAASVAAAEKLRKGEDDTREILVFSHYPLSSLSCRHPALDLLKKAGVRRVFYGHLHMVSPANLPPAEEDGVTFSLVSADYLDFDPIKIEK